MAHPKRLCNIKKLSKDRLIVQLSEAHNDLARANFEILKDKREIKRLENSLGKAEEYQEQAESMLTGIMKRWGKYE